MATKRSLRVRMGHFLTVENTERRFGSAKYYHLVKLQRESGKEFYAMFTANQISVAQKRALDNKEDIVESLKIVDWLD